MKFKSIGESLKIIIYVLLCLSISLKLNLNYSLLINKMGAILIDFTNISISITDDKRINDIRIRRL